MNNILVVPLPAQDYLLVRLQVPQSKYAKRDPLFISILVLPLCSAKHGPEDGIGSTTAANEPGLIGRDPAVERDILQWAKR